MTLNISDYCATLGKLTMLKSIETLKFKNTSRSLKLPDDEKFTSSSQIFYHYNIDGKKSS